MSELDQLYQEFYAEVTTKIWADYEDFKKAKTDYFAKAQVEEFQYLLLNISGNFSHSYEDPEVNKINYQVTAWNNFRNLLIQRFDYYKKEICKDNPVHNFLEERLKKIIIETQYSFAVPSKEILAKTFAFYDAYIDTYEQLKAELNKENSFPIMTVKQTLSKWLADGENERVVDALQDISNKFGDKYFVNDVTHQAGRFSNLNKNFRNGIIDDDFFNRELNKIRQALQNLIEDVPDHAILPNTIDEPLTSTPSTVSGQEPLASTIPSTDKPNPTQSSFKSLWIVGLGVLMGVTLLAALVPCPSDFLSGTTQVLMAMGAAMAATALPGLLNIDLPNVKAGSALAVLVLVYLFNPAKIVENNSRCNKEPFEFTINLQQDRRIQLSNQYPKLENATLQIWIGNDWRSVPVDANNLGDYKSIPGDYKDQKVPVKLLGKYWYVKEDSVQLSGKSQTLTIVPDGTLGMIQGKVFNGDGTDLLASAIIEIAGELDTTDEQGNFNFFVPLEKQQEQYEVVATKQGYNLIRQFVYPAAGVVQIRLNKK